MKKLFLFLFLLIGSFQLNAQDFEGIADAFEQGDSRTLAKHFDAFIDVNIDGETSSVGRSDAENKLRTFFMNNEPRNFETMHTGSSDGGVQYIIGSLMTGGGGFRITLYMHQVGEEYLVSTIEIEKE